MARGAEKNDDEARGTVATMTTTNEREALDTVANELDTYQAKWRADLGADVREAIEETAERCRETTGAVGWGAPTALETRLRLARAGSKWKHGAGPTSDAWRAFCALRRAFEDAAPPAELPKAAGGADGREFSSDVTPVYERASGHGGEPRAVPHVETDAWDDCDVYVARGAYGIIGTIRAQSWESAWEAFEDDLAPDADPEDVCNYRADYDGAVRTDGEVWELFDLGEGIAHRANGAPTNGLRVSYLADTSDCVLDLVTPELAESLGLLPILPGSPNWYGPAGE